MRKIVAAICLLFGCHNSDSVKTTNDLGIPISIGQAKIALDKGINLSGWFTDFPILHYTQADFRQMT